MAFVSSFVGASLTNASTLVCGKPAARVNMSAGPMSAAVPFFERPKNLDGTLPGDVGFDPLGFSDRYDINFLRCVCARYSYKLGSDAIYVESLKLAIVGWFFPEVVYHLPNDMYSAVNPLDAPGKVGWGPCLQILLGIALVEAATWEKLYKGNVGGDYGFDPLKLAAKPEARKRMQLAEVKNGRLAMCAIGGAIHHALLTHQGMFEQINAGNWFSSGPVVTPF